jgi:cytochrome P450
VTGQAAVPSQPNLAALSDSDLDAMLGSRTFIEDPYSVYAELRRRDPIHWSDTWGVWVLTRYEDTMEVFRASSVFSNAGRFSALLEQLPPQAQVEAAAIARHNASGMLQSDPPDHTRLRALVRMAFTPRVIEGLRGRIHEVVNSMLDELLAAGQMDVIEDFAHVLPLTVICELMGIPPEDRGVFFEWGADLSGFQATGGARLENARRAAIAVEKLEDYFNRLCDNRRANPREDLISYMVEAHVAGDRLSQDELINMSVNLLFAGHDTTRSLIGNSLVTLLRHPADMNELRRDDGAWPTAIEECLRYESPVQRGWRRMASDHDFHGNPLKKGQLVFMMLGAANRDPAQFPDSDRFDIHRGENRHVAFGYGIHFCIGAPLARLEAPIALQTLLRRAPKLELAAAPRWHDNIHLRGLESLQIRF